MSGLQQDLAANTVGCCRHLPLPRADAESKHQQEAAIEQLLAELDIDLLVLARCVTHACLNVLHSQLHIHIQLLDWFALYQLLVM